MKKLRLTSDYNFDFDLLGITSSVKDYKLTWAINKHLQVKFARQQDHQITIQNKNFSYVYFFDEPVPEVRLRLFSNKPVIHKTGTKTLLVPEAPHFDFIFMREGDSQSFSVKTLQDLLKEVPVIEYLSAMDLSKVKHLEHFVF